MPRKKAVKADSVKESKKPVKELNLPIETKETAPNEVLKWAQTKFGKKQKVSVTSASDLFCAKTLRRPTGVPDIDLAASGGLPARGITEILGPDGVGKTYFLYRLAGMVQKNYKEKANIVIYNTELGLDKGQARLAEFCIAYTDEEIAEYNELRQREGLPPFTAEEVADLKLQVGTVLVIQSSSAEEGLRAFIDCIASGFFQLALLDSLGSLYTKVIEDKEIGSKTFNNASIAITDMVIELACIFLSNPQINTSVVVINQVRADMDAGKYGDPTREASSAWALKHNKVVSIKFYTSLKAPLKDEAGNDVGKWVRWKFKKGKAGMHEGPSGEFKYFHFIKNSEVVFWKDVQSLWLGGIDVYYSLLEVATSVGVIVVKGSWYNWMEDGKAILSVQGAVAMATALSEDPANFDKIMKQCLNKKGIMVRYT